MTDRKVALIAHRAGNDPATAKVAASVADIIELDVHLFRGRTEVRHSKALWPTSRLFEEWQLLPRSAARPTLARVLEALPGDQRLWIDLKGPDPRLPGRVIEHLGGREGVCVSARSWWLLAPFRSLESVRTFMSVGVGWQRALARWCSKRGWGDGIVMHEQLATAAFVEQLPDAASLAAWAVDDLGRVVELAELGFDGLIVDDLELIREGRGFLDARGL